MVIAACLCGCSAKATSAASTSELALDAAAQQGHLRKAESHKVHLVGHSEVSAHAASAAPSAADASHWGKALARHFPMLRLLERVSSERRVASQVGQQPQPAQHGPPQHGPHPLVVGLIDAVVIGTIMVIVAFIYLRMGFRVEATEEGTVKPSTDEPKFNFGLFDFENCCDRDMSICCCSFCCLPVRWADTVSQDKLKIGLSFWAAVAVVASLWALDSLSGGLTVLLFTVCAVLTRQKMRKAMGLENGTPSSMCLDCLVWCFCAPCAAAQEAREVQYMPVREGSA